MRDVENEEAVKCLPLSNNQCRNSRYLKEGQEEHESVPPCDEELEEHFKECMEELKQQVITKALDRELRRKVAGLEPLDSIEWCTIL